MEKESVDSFLKPLENLQQVDAPAFLFTRISRAIDAIKYERVPRGKAVLAGLAFCVIALINTLVVLQNEQPVKKTENTLQSFNLLPNNDIYR